MLYQDCVVDNFGSLAHSIQDHLEHPIQHAKRLTFHINPCPYVPLYALIFAQSIHWRMLELRSDTEHQEPPQAVSLLVEPLAVAQLERVFSELVSNGASVLPSLERVVFQADYQHTDDIDPCISEELFVFRVQTRPRISLPYLFLDHPSVKHYCQDGLYGPLAILPALTNVTNRPKVVTFHLPSGYPEIYPRYQLPVILGTTNRYVFASRQYVLCNLDGDNEATIRYTIDQALIGILTTLEQSDDVMDKEPVGTGRRVSSRAELGEEFKNTRVEIYGAIHYMTMAAVRASYGGDPDRWRKSESLAPFQAVLDKMVGPWKGQVLLKRREETPPCTACDLDCQSHWKVLDDEEFGRG